jgi:hypothetical protein
METDLNSRALYNIIIYLEIDMIVDPCEDQTTYRQHLTTFCSWQPLLGILFTLHAA